MPKKFWNDPNTFGSWFPRWPRRRRKFIDPSKLPWRPAFYRTVALHIDAVTRSSGRKGL